jgi:hypothetical protein
MSVQDAFQLGFEFQAPFFKKLLFFSLIQLKQTFELPILFLQAADSLIRLRYRMAVRLGLGLQFPSQIPDCLSQPDQFASQGVIYMLLALCESSYQ